MIHLRARALAPLAFMALITWQSHQDPMIHEVAGSWDFVGIDKVAHLAAFGVLAGLWLWALEGTAKRKAGIALRISVAFAFFDEGHQALLPYRSAELGDLVADVLGALGAIVAHRSRPLCSDVDGARTD